MNGPIETESDYEQSITSICRALESLKAESLTSLKPQENAEVSSAIKAAMESPIDFPPIGSAIVPGDRVALAIDPNLPSADRIITALIEVLERSGAGIIDLVIGTEATDENKSSLETLLGERGTVHLHQTHQRASFRYLGPDVGGDPVYLNRWLVDADLVIPVTTKRLSNSSIPQQSDLTGIYPTFADSEARHRQHLSRRKENMNTDIENPEFDSEAMIGSAEEPAWLLGVQFLVSVVPNEKGRVSSVQCGSIDSMRKESETGDLQASVYDFVTATIEGDASQHTWMNIARAAEAASVYTNRGGTIVIWSDVSETTALSTSENAHDDTDSPSQTNEEDFERWNEEEVPFVRLESISEDYQLILRSRLKSDEIEQHGLGSLNSTEELERLAMAFPKRGFLRSAQYHTPF